MPQKRTTTQPLAAPAPTKAGKPSKASRGANHSPTSLAPSSNSPGTPALTPSSSATPPSSFAQGLSLARSSKKLTKAVRHGNSHGGHGGGGKGTMKTRKAAVEGPEAELSGEEESDDDVGLVEEEVLPGVERVIEGSEDKSGPKSEVSMHTLLDGAKLRPETHNISRGYELLTSPASRLVIPFDSINSIYHSGTAGNRGGAGKFGSTPSSPGFSDDVEWEWEDLCFEMDGLDVSNRPVTGTTTPVKKDAYAEVVKRVAA